MNKSEANHYDSSIPPSEEFIQLFTKAQRQLYLFILAQSGNTQTAEEILQETNLVIWSKYSQFESGTNFMAWVRQIAVYEVLKWRQKRNRDKLTFSDDFVQRVAGSFTPLPEQTERRQLALKDCLKKLNTQDRELIDQRYQPGITGKELANSLNRPPNSVYQSLGRIRKTLLECVQRTMAVET